MDDNRDAPQGPEGRGLGDVAEGVAGAVSGMEFAGMGIQFVVAILLFLFVGKWLDSRLGTVAWLSHLGVFVGAAAVSTRCTGAFPRHNAKSKDVVAKAAIWRRDQPG